MLRKLYWKGVGAALSKIGFGIEDYRRFGVDWSDDHPPYPRYVGSSVEQTEESIDITKIDIWVNLSTEIPWSERNAWNAKWESYYEGIPMTDAERVALHRLKPKVVKQFGYWPFPK